MIFNTESQEQNNQEKIKRRNLLKKIFLQLVSENTEKNERNVGKTEVENILSKREFIKNIALSSAVIGLTTYPLNALSQVFQKNESTKQLSEKTIGLNIREIEIRLRSLVEKYSTCTEEAKLEIMRSVGELLTLQSSIPEEDQHFRDQIGETINLGIFMLHLDQNDWRIPVSHSKETIHLKAFSEIENFVDLKYTNVQYNNSG